jgi:hypothetical protein
VLEHWTQSRQAIHPDLNVIVLGDHGMHSTVGTVEVSPLLEDLGCMPRPHRDPRLWWFVDSTMLRVWSDRPGDSDAMRSRLTTALADRACGRVLSTSEMEVVDPQRSRAFGDAIFVCNPGWVLSPDFFRSAGVPAGMHGYHPSHDHEQGVCIGWGGRLQRRTEREMPLTRSHALLKHCVRM